MAVESFWESLRQIYENNGFKKDWPKEEPHLKDIIRLLEDHLKDRYTLNVPLGVGGNGIVIKVEDNNLNAPRAMKFPRPNEQKMSMFVEIMLSEISRLKEAVHPHIIEIYLQDKIIWNQNDIPFYIMQFIKGAFDAHKYFRGASHTADDIIHIIKQVVDGLCHLHEIKIVHCDMKLENILVGLNGHAVISDLGSARSLDGPPNEEIDLVFDSTYAHPDLEKLKTYASTKQRTYAQGVPRSSLKKAFDLYALGKNVIRVLKYYKGDKANRLDPYKWKYLMLMAERLLDGRNSTSECVLGLPAAFFAELKYNEISETRKDIQKITGEYPLHEQIPEINEHNVGNIQTSSITPTPFTQHLKEMLKDPFIRRLAGISQLGFINLVYPTATHSRLEHVLGTFSNAVRYCDALYHDPINPLFKQIMNEDDLKAGFLAALCHDVGQYALAHDMEEAAHNIFSHTKLSTKILRENITFSRDGKPLSMRINEVWGVEPNRVVNIISADLKDTKIPIKDRLLHTIIDGPIDADKLDYLVRDSLNLNVPFGRAIEFERLLQCLTVVFREKKKKVHIAIGIHEKGKIPAETVAFARYAMFGAVYWHHTTRALKAMLHRAIWEKLPYDDNTEKEEYLLAFTKFVLHKHQLRTIQNELEFPIDDKTPYPDVTQVLPSDREMLEWCYDKTNDAGRELIRKIMDRQIFKRILVISEARNGEKNEEIWEILSKLQNSNRDWRKIVSLQKMLQEHIVNDIKEFKPPRGKRIPASKKSDIDALVKSHDSGKILILVDIPCERKGSSSVLEYLPESDRRTTLGNWEEPTPLEDSVLWENLHNNFLRSVGKVRVFCHDRFRDAIEYVIKKSDLEEMFNKCVEKLA